MNWKIVLAQIKTERAKQATTYQEWTFCGRQRNIFGFFFRDFFFTFIKRYSTKKKQQFQLKNSKKFYETKNMKNTEPPKMSKKFGIKRFSIKSAKSEKRNFEWDKNNWYDDDDNDELITIIMTHSKIL